MDLRQPGGQQSSCATRDRIHAQMVRLYAKASEPRMERAESAGITTVFREHYKQLGSPLVCRVRRGQLRPRDS
jgi:hypothetical protein